MRREDVPPIARWNQDLEFTASIGTPGDADTLEMRQEAFDRGSRVTPGSVELRSSCSRSPPDRLRRPLRHHRARRRPVRRHRRARALGQRLRSRGCRLICEYGLFFRSLHDIKVEVNGYNERAIRLYEHLGFRSWAASWALLLNGNRYDQVIMDIGGPRVAAREPLPGSRTRSGRTMTARSSRPAASYRGAAMPVPLCDAVRDCLRSRPRLPSSAGRAQTCASRSGLTWAETANLQRASGQR